MAITNTQIKKWNETFKKASKPEKKILIAKDVLANIKSKKYNSEKGNYITHMNGDYNGYDDVQKNLDKLESCNCCALGACLISSTKYQNKLTFNDLYCARSNNNNVWGQLKTIFTPKEMAIMEYCFEGNEGSKVAEDSFYYYLDEKTTQKCDSFFYQYNSSNERLTAICNNIIKNKGFIKI